MWHVRIVSIVYVIVIVLLSKHLVQIFIIITITTINPRSTKPREWTTWVKRTQHQITTLFTLSRMKFHGVTKLPKITVPSLTAPPHLSEEPLGDCCNWSHPYTVLTAPTFEFHTFPTYESMHILASKLSPVWLEYYKKRMSTHNRIIKNWAYLCYQIVFVNLVCIVVKSSPAVAPWL